MSDFHSGIALISVSLPTWLPGYVRINMWMEIVDTGHSNSTQTAPFPCRDGERHEKILSNQAGSEFNDVSTYPASSAPCPLTSSQNVSALSRIDKGPAHHGSPTLSSRYLSHQTPWSSISRRPAASQVLELTRESLNRSSNRTFPAWSAHLLCALVKKVIVLQAQLRRGGLKFSSPACLRRAP